MKSPLSDLPLIVRRDHPDLRGHIDRLVRSEELVPVLRGVLRWRGVEPTLELLAAAVCAWNPRAVILGASAAALTWWPGLRPTRIDAAIRPPRSVPTWLRCTELSVPPTLVWERAGLRLACPELSVLGMVEHQDASAICEAYRRRATTWAHLTEAMSLLPNRAGNQLRRRLVAISRDNPWSPLEMEAHQQLRGAGVKGWCANHRVVLAGHTHFLDIAFPDHLLAIELDGWETHSSRDSFISDRVRQNRLATAGWVVLRYTSATLHQLVPEVRKLLR
ncbi:MAG: hypothetical protein Q4D89_05765 [Arachnia propionica]|uniref:endonuclease domain-containing protein n=1 Tax=Arachnia propionica TaxID=1750 RepID=UPI00270D4542|nr:hypothetical protein [Arachnia propionica]